MLLNQINFRWILKRKKLSEENFQKAPNSIFLLSWILRSNESSDSNISKYLRILNSDRRILIGRSAISYP